MLGQSVAATPWTAAIVIDQKVARSSGHQLRPHLIYLPQETHKRLSISIPFSSHLYLRSVPFLSP
jgi:hypothetical protein